LLAGPPSPQDNSQDAQRGDMRRRLFAYTKALIKFRTSSTELSVNDTDFIFTDFNDNKRVVVWKRGGAAAVAPVIVVANFSDFGSAPGTDYVIPSWPSPTPAGKKWHEVTQSRDVDPNYVGREAVYPWEAKVYVLVDI
jgi:pullulanase